MELSEKLALLADAAKYDASCSSSGGQKRDARGTGGIGSTEGMGICHSYTPDGRCVSLLKILLTNFCIFDCAYCINRVARNVPPRALQRGRSRAADAGFLPAQLHRGPVPVLGASSASGDYTMEKLVEVARRLARGPSVRRLHPSQDHSRCLAGTAGGGRALGRSPEHQCRVADRGRAEGAGAGKEPARHPQAMGGLRLGIDEVERRSKKAPRVRAGGAEHADDRRRRRGRATATSWSPATTSTATTG